MTHDEAVNATLLAVSRLGHRAWRREVGNFYDRRALEFVAKNGPAVVQRVRPHKIGVPGEADVQGMLVGGHALAIEVKTGNAVRTEGQKKWARMFQSMGGCYILARWNDSVDGSATIELAVAEYLKKNAPF